MYIEPVSVLEHRLDNLVLSIADRYLLPYNLVRAQCRPEVEGLLRCWESSLDPFVECRLELEVLEECVEELGDGYE